MKLTNFCVLNFQTVKSESSLRALTAEVLRQQKSPAENIQQERSCMNSIDSDDWNCGGDYYDLYKSISQNEYYTKPDNHGRLHKPPQVKAVTIVLAYSPEANIDEEKWIQTNIAFIKQFNFPFCAVTHRDELSLHQHICIIPCSENGKIAGRNFIKNNKDLEELHTRYAEYLQENGIELERGVRRSRKKSRKQLSEYDELQNKITEYEKQIQKNAEYLNAQMAAIQSLNTAIQNSYAQYYER